MACLTAVIAQSFPSVSKGETLLNKTEREERERRSA
jgi:hypothetical protein